MEAHSISLQGFLKDAFEFDLLATTNTLGKVLISHEVVVDLFDQIFGQVMGFAIPIEFIPQETLTSHSGGMFVWFI